MNSNVYIYIHMDHSDYHCGSLLIIGVYIYIYTYTRYVYIYIHNDKSSILVNLVNSGNDEFEAYENTMAIYDLGGRTLRCFFCHLSAVQAKDHKVVFERLETN